MRALRPVLVLCVLSVASAAVADVVGDWNRLALDAMRYAHAAPGRVARSCTSLVLKP
jgi:hypothetical protein